MSDFVMFFEIIIIVIIIPPVEIKSRNYQRIFNGFRIYEMRIMI